MLLSGEASSGGRTAKGADAFFKSTNAHKGVFKRKINYDYKDDAYDPANTFTGYAPARPTGPRLRDLQPARDGAEHRDGAPFLTPLGAP